jgi:formate hydrogenlyase subunit 3/multisubunit Na+/H+ antiporter MnhD subunit
MTNVLLILTPVLPLVLLPLLGSRSKRWWLLPVATLPALATAVFVPVGSDLQLPWLLLGVHLALDATGQLFLLFSALIWLAAGLHAASPESRTDWRGVFGVSFLMAMAGNLLLLVAADMVTFYLGFALMGLSAYGMLIQRPSQRARRAGRVYLAFTLVGEIALLAGMLVLVASTDSLLFADLAGQELPATAVGLLLLGFGIKVALPGLHGWLPLAYTAAPVAATAVLSGPMMKAGLLGWLRFLPPEAGGLEAWAPTLMVLGAAGVALGTLLGVVQSNPRTVLAYSSIAKMGLMSALFGAVMAGMANAEAIVAALVLFAVHHLLVKSALFLGVGEWERRGARPWVLVGLGILALAMVGLPLTGGAAAKLTVSNALAGELSAMLTLSAIATTLLMARFMYLLTRSQARQGCDINAASVAWISVIPLALWGPFSPEQVAIDAAGTGPVAVGLGIAGIAWLLSMRWPHRSIAFIPRGLRRRLLHSLRMAGRGLPRWRMQFELPTFSMARRAAEPEPQQASLMGAGLRWLSVLMLLLIATLAPN